MTAPYDFNAWLSPEAIPPHLRAEKEGQDGHQPLSAEHVMENVTMPLAVDARFWEAIGRFSLDFSGKTVTDFALMLTGAGAMLLRSELERHVSCGPALDMAHRERVSAALAAAVTALAIRSELMRIARK